MNMFSDEYFMHFALQQAELAFDEGEIPVLQPMLKCWLSLQPAIKWELNT
jgi:tRNA(Arg) A34 adenosine deaminase TadA